MSIHMTIRNFLILFLLAHLLSCSENVRPLNVVVFIADDVSWNDFGCYGNTSANTPTIDSLANNGLIFKQAFLTTSSCSPSRASIISGRYPHSTGAPELHMPLPDDIPTLGGVLKKSGYFVGASGKWHLGDAAKKDFDHVLDTDIGLGGEDRWNELIDSIPENKPYFLWLASIDAHRVWGENKFNGTTKEESIEVPPYMLNDSVTKKDFASYYDEIKRFDYHIKNSLKHLENIGRLDNTLVIIMADNGRPFPRDKTRMFDSGIKTPLIFYWHGKDIGDGKETEAMVSSIDISKTILELSNIKSPDSFQGLSFAKVLTDANAKHRSHIFAEHNWHDYSAYERMVRTEQFLYIENQLPNKPMSSAADVHSGDAFQRLVQEFYNNILDTVQLSQFDSIQPRIALFDCINDPHQIQNLAEDPINKPIIDSLAQILHSWQRKTGDSFPNQLTQDRYDFYFGKDLEPEKHFLDIERGEIPGSL